MIYTQNKTPNVISQHPRASDGIMIGGSYAGFKSLECISERFSPPAFQEDNTGEECKGVTTTRDEAHPDKSATTKSSGRRDL